MGSMVDSSWVQTVCDIENPNSISISKTQGNIRVFCRIRPTENLNAVTVADSSNIFIKLKNRKIKSYNFDGVFNQASSQDEVFSEIEPVIKSVLDGYNACIFAYGQTGTGKTFTMEGRDDDPGIVPRTFKAIFKQAEERKHSFMISLSMVEIYMGLLQDLLAPNSPCLSIQTNRDGGIEIENLASIQVNEFHQALRLYRLGCRFRSTASTNSNTTSSRSHCMIRIAITCFCSPERQRHANKIWLVDLGGSERVLKTKALGRRFDEGKAINLSLSALGDVINALQRKKSHIPYRNSKLTQVLKDSLGDDSKTLMLVHVSPREEDLCETVCSLNFATRVKNVHLGNEDTNEVQKQKEAAMKNLQQKMTENEHKQLDVKKEIATLKEKLENLTGKCLFSEEQVEAYDFNGQQLKNRNMLPSFMRPTICSRVKSEVIYPSSECKVQVRRKRRTTPHRAESVTLPVKDYSDYKSEHSISRSSCSETLNKRSCADNATEHSQDTSESDIKLEAYNIKNSRVDNWFHLQNNGTSTSGYNNRIKRIIAIPTSRKKQMQQENGKAQKQNEKTYSTNNLKMHEVVSNNKKDKSVPARRLGMSPAEVESDKSLRKLNDLLNEDLKCNFISASQTTEEKRTIQTQEDKGDLSLDNKGWPISSTKEHEHNNRREAHTFSIMQQEKGKTKGSDIFQSSNHVDCKFLQTNLDESIAWSKGDSGSSISMSEELCYQQAHNESVVENVEGKDLSFYIQPPMKEKPHDMLHRRSQKSLFTNDSDKELTKQYNKLQAEKNNEGICCFLKQKLEVLLASALLGLGFCSLGYEHEFFYSLEL